MGKQALVVGLGMFGMALARELTQRRVEVICVDRDEDLVQRAAEFASEALCFDATDEASLTEIAPERRDICICAIGEDSREASIVCTALLSQLGARKLVARAYDPLHERILRMVGANDIVNPEQESGRRLAGLLSLRGVLDQRSIGGDLLLTELVAPRAFVGNTLRKLGLPQTHGIFVVALRDAQDDPNSTRAPRPDDVLAEGDVLLVIAPEGNVDKMLRGLS